MAIDLTGIINRNEYYTNHYLAAIFEENVKETTESWKTAGERTPWARLREAKRSWYAARESVLRGRQDEQKFHLIQSLALAYLAGPGVSRCSGVSGDPPGNDRAEREECGPGTA